MRKTLGRINKLAILVLFPIAICILLGIALLLIDRAATQYDKSPDPRDDQIGSGK